MAETIGVVVVHGIGDPAPGEAMQHLTAALAGHEDAGYAYQFDAPTEQPLLGQHPNKPYLPSLIPMRLQQGRLTAKESTEQKELVVAEVFWGSASQLPAGMMGVLQGVIRLFFRAGAIVQLAAQDHEHDPPLVSVRRIFYRLTALVSYLLTKPVFALNLLLLAAFVIYHYGIPFVADPGPDMAVGTFVWGSAGLALLVGIGGLGLYKWRPHGVWQQLVAPAWWLVGAALLWLVVTPLQVPTEVGNAIFLPTSAVILLMFGVALLLALLIVGRGLHWLLGEWRTERARHQGPPLTISLFTLFVQYGLWVTVVPTLWTMLLDYSGRDQTLVAIYASMARTDGIQWIATIAISCFGLLTLLLRWWQTRRLTQSGNAEGPQAPEAPRLIINPLISVPMAIFTLAATAFVMMIGIYDWLEWSRPWWADEFLEWLQSIRGTPLVASLVLLLIPLIGGPLRLALDLVNDIITYADQRQRPTAVTPGARPPVGMISARLQLVFDQLYRRGDLDRLVIIAHSQGTVIVLDELARANHPLCVQLAGRIDLITMGSPITHLYQKYFPGDYPRWTRTDVWQRLYARVRRWRHFYRIDDFVGMRIDPPNQPTVDFAQWGIGAGGHTDYWDDDRLIALVHPLLWT